MNKLLLLIVTLLLAGQVSGQFLAVNGNIVVEESSTEGTKIIIFKNNNKLEEQIIGKKGRFDLKLALGADYRLTFEKDGYVTKTVNIAADVPEEVIETNPNFPPVKLIINLLPKVEGIDISIFDQPIAILAYNYELDDFTFEKDYSDKIRDKVGETERNLRRAIAEKGAVAVEKERLFAELLGKGDNAFAQKKWQSAIENWKKALQVKPENKEIPDKINIAEKELAKEAAERSIAEQNAKAYRLLVRAGDSLFNKQEYADAKTRYKNAIELNKEDTYPGKKIAEIETILNNRAQQIAATDAAYQKAITTADKAFLAKEYENAITGYNEALTVKVTESYPKNQIEKATQAIAQLKLQQEAEAERKRQEATRIAELTNKYNQLIADADAAFKSERYAQAKIGYQAADKLNIGEVYPKTKLKEIDDILASSKYQSRLTEYNKNKKEGDNAMSARNYASAKFYYQKAIDILPIDSEELRAKLIEIEKFIEEERLATLTKEYNIQIEKADKAYAEKSYAVARFYYKKALEIKKDDKHATERLEEVEKLVSERTEKTFEL